MIPKINSVDINSGFLPKNILILFRFVLRNDYFMADLKPGLFMELLNKIRD